MLTALALASSLWVAAHEAGARADVPQPVVPVEQIADDAGRDIAWIVGAHSADLYSTGKTATVLRWIVVAAHAGLVANNIHQARRR